MTRFITASMASLALVLLMVTPVAADERLSLPVDTVIRAGAGSLVVLGDFGVDSDDGSLCTQTATVEAFNQSSVHPGNDIILRSGESQVVLVGVEDSPGKVTTSSSTIRVVDDVVALLRMGPDGVFSGGIEISLDLGACEPTSTTTVVEPIGPTDDGTSGAASTTVAPTSSTTAAPTTTAPTTDADRGVGSDTTSRPPALPQTGSGLLGLLTLVGTTFVILGLGLLRRGSHPLTR